MGTRPMGTILRFDEVPLRKMGTDLLGPNTGGLDSVSCPLKLGLSLGQDSNLMSGNCDS
jgi:hypothetical protein